MREVHALRALTLLALAHSAAEVQVAPHFKTRVPEPSFLKLEEQGAGKPWFLADATIWQHTRLWLHPDVPNLFGFGFNEAPITSEHVGVQLTLNFTHTDYMLPDSFVAVWLTTPETMDMAVTAQQVLFKKQDRLRADQFPLWRKDDSSPPPKLSGLAIVAHRSAETPQLNVKVVNLETVSADPKSLEAAFSSAEPKLQFNPAKSPQLHLSLLRAKGEKFPKIQVWGQPAGDKPDGSWTELLSAQSRAGDQEGEVALPLPSRLGFTSYSGQSASGKTACGVQVVALHVYSYEKSQGASDKGYLSALTGRASEGSIQEALKGMAEDFKSEYSKHVEVIAKTREQLQRLEKQVSQMETKVDGFTFDKAPGKADSGEHHGLLHALKEAKSSMMEESDKVKAEIDKTTKKGGSDSKSMALMVENLDKAVERNRSSSTWSLLFLLVVACGGVGVVYQKMQKYEKRHHL